MGDAYNMRLCVGKGNKKKKKMRCILLTDDGLLLLGSLCLLLLLTLLLGLLLALLLLGSRGSGRGRWRAGRSARCRSGRLLLLLLGLLLCISHVSVVVDDDVNVF